MRCLLVFRTRQVSSLVFPTFRRFQYSDDVDFRLFSFSFQTCLSIRFVSRLPFLHLFFRSARQQSACFLTAFFGLGGRELLAFRLLFRSAWKQITYFSCSARQQITFCLTVFLVCKETKCLLSDCFFLVCKETKCLLSDGFFCRRGSKLLGRCLLFSACQGTEYWLSYCFFSARMRITFFLIAFLVN